VTNYFRFNTSIISVVDHDAVYKFPKSDYRLGIHLLVDFVKPFGKPVYRSAILLCGLSMQLYDRRLRHLF
jgi:hypothetical protein